MRLKNEVGLTGEPEARVLEVREHGFRGVVNRGGSESGDEGCEVSEASAVGTCTGAVGIALLRKRRDAGTMAAMVTITSITLGRRNRANCVGSRIPS